MRRRQFDKTMIVYKTVTAKDTVAGFTETPMVAAANVPCKIQAMGGSEQLIYRREGVRVTHWLWCDGDVPVTPQHSIEVNEIPGVTFDVKFVREIEGRRPRLQIVAEEIRHGQD